jgi:phage terminase large subunit
VRFTQSHEGPLKLFALPDRNTERGKYVVAGDPTRTVYGDYACAQVINRRTLEQVAVYRAKTDPTTFAEELFKLGIFFNEALLTTEVEGGGYATVGALVTMNYPNLVKRERPDSTRGKSTRGAAYGWSSTAKSKNLAIGWTKKIISDGDVTIHDSHTFTEMKNYVTKPDGSFGPADDKNGHDDTVMSFAVALTTHILDGILEPYDMASPIQATIPTSESPEHDDDPEWMSWKPR